VGVVYNFEGFVKDEEAQLKNLVFVLPSDAAGARHGTFKGTELKANLAFSHHWSASEKQFMRSAGLFSSHNKIPTPHGLSGCRICHINAGGVRRTLPRTKLKLSWRSPVLWSSRATSTDQTMHLRDLNETVRIDDGCTGAGLMRRLLFKFQNDDAMMLADCGKLICSFDDADAFLEAQQVA
jgi:hypothetical protein